jgi:NADPH-dependent glutamate synthase beta subunit-like oxidoreductase
MAIGQDVDVAALNEGDLGLHKKWGTIEVDETTMMTNLPGVFSGGDCVTGAATVVEGVGAGRLGAFAINAYLNGADEAGIAAAIFQHKPEFFDIGAEVEVGFSEEEAQREAGRCLMCRCQATGVCTLQSLSIEYGAVTKTYLGKDAWK